MAKKGLGRGFESLIPIDLFDETFDPTADDDRSISDLKQLKLSSITADPDQPRKRFDDTALAELTESIKRHGVLQPIVVTKHGKDGYEIIAGERRYRASKLAGLETIPAIIRSASGQHKLELALIENLQRRDLNALETATAYAKLRDQFSLTLEGIGQAVGGKSISAISNTLRLLRLPKEVQQAIVDGQITEGQARPLIDLDEETTLRLLPAIVKDHWSARKVEEAIRQLKQAETPAHERKISPYESEINAFTQRFETPVKIQVTKSGAGKIMIDFSNQEEFERIKKTLL